MSIYSKMFDANVRTEEIIHLPSMALTDSLPEVLEEALEDDFDRLHKLLGYDEDTDEDDLKWMVSDDTNDGKFGGGFLVQMATPVPEYGPAHENHHNFTCSWGHYTTKWFLADDLETIFEQSLEWAEDYRRKEFEKQVSTAFSTTVC